ncbi:hypothetical protein P389DRAFT_88149 [Cystobasidium minutum MCA 4210]|uniref:uncharacterized protein n=1 Tax=Cystobasidium minutum MCA 4210 TaxID=1397322 RepID=UPI0034CD6E21|eukprot:jgi/Rhomi1/88149/CE88148_186
MVDNAGIWLVVVGSTGWNIASLLALCSREFSLELLLVNASEDPLHWLSIQSDLLQTAYTITIYPPFAPHPARHIPSHLMIPCRSFSRNGQSLVDHASRDKP